MLKKLLNSEENKNKVKIMKRTIIDSSTFINYCFFNNPFHKESNNLIDNLVVKQDFCFIVPSIFLYEVFNVLRTKSFCKQIDQNDIDQTKIALNKLHVKYVNFENHTDETLNFACRENISIYDASYVALSIDKKCDFWTCDKKLFDKLKPKYKNIKFIGNYK